MRQDNIDNGKELSKIVGLRKKHMSDAVVGFSRVYSRIKSGFFNVQSWLKEHRSWTIPLVTFAMLYISLYMLILANFNLLFSVASSEQASVKNFFITGNLEAALRRYKTASLMKLPNRPNILFLSWFGFPQSMPNREPLWTIVRATINHHSKNYIIEGFPAISARGWGRGTRGTPDKYIGVDLAYIDLRDVKLAECDFTLFDFYHADLRGSDLRQYPEGSCPATNLSVSSENYTLWVKAYHQFIERKQHEIEREVRYCVDTKTKIDSGTVLK